MSNSFYNHTTYPAPNSPGSSLQMRNELEAITSGFNKLPTLSLANAYKLAMVNSAGTALVASSALQGLAVTSSTIDSTPIGATTAASGKFTTLQATGNVNLGSSVTITGGTINGTAIGGSSASTGAFTTVTASSGFTGNLTGNVTGSVTGNVTGNLTGNVTGNVTANSGTSTFNNVTINGTLDMDAGSSATIINLPNPTNNGDAANKAYVDTQDALKLSLAGGTMSGAIAMGTNRITGLGDPVGNQDAATKAYVDTMAQGLDAKGSCRVATTGNITLSGTQTIDGVAVIAGDRVLVKNQSTASQNGIYVVAAGSWSRSTDADSWTELLAAFTFVEQGTANANNGYVCTITAGGTLGTTDVTWAQFSGAGQIDAGAGLTKTGNQLNVGTASSSRIVVNADNIDLAATGVTANTYRSVTVDIYGRVTGGTNPTTIAGYGITDAYTKTEADNLLATKLNLSGGTMSGNIAMGSNKITGLADPTSGQDATTKTYVDGILGSATSAAASASAAALSATNAANSATAAAGSATSAASSATSAAASYDAFDDRYLGSKTADPTVDNDGNALLTGALYWNSVSNLMKVYNGAAWEATYLPASGYLQLSGGTLTGALGVVLGTASAPGLFFSGDSNTGLYSPGANILAATTGGTESWRSLDNGSFLLGDTTDRAGARLQVTGTGLIRGSGAGAIYLEDSSVGDTSSPFYYLSSASGTMTFGKANRSGVNTTGSTSLGNVTSSGVWNLGTAGTAVISNDSNRGRIDLFEGTSKAKSLLLLNGNGSGSIGMRSNEPLNLLTNDTVRLSIGADGASTLTVNSSSDALRITQTGSGNALVVEDSANPDATPFVVNANGQVGIGLGGTSIPGNYGLLLRADSADLSLGLQRYNNDGGGQSINLAKARGSLSAYAIVQNGDKLGSFTFAGNDGAGATNFITGAEIFSAVDGTPGTNDMPGRLVFSTTADGASSPTERMRIDNAGRVGIGGSVPGATTLQLSKNITGGTTAQGMVQTGAIQSDVTTVARYFQTYAVTAAASFTLPNLEHYSVTQGTFGAGSTVTNQIGFRCGSISGATNNYGAYSEIASGTGCWNFYAAGSAPNYFAGLTTIGSALQEARTAVAASDINLSSGNYFTKTISGATTFTVSNVPASGTTGAFILELTNGGSATVTWWSGVKWAGGTAPTLTAAGVDVIAFYTHDGGTTWRGAVVAKDSK